MKIAGRKAASVLEMLDDHVKPGVTTEELDQIAFKFITEELKHTSKCWLQWLPKNIMHISK